MARAKSLNSYSPLLWDIVKRVALTKGEYSLAVADRRAAMAMQGKFYAFRGALKRELENSRLDSLGYTADRLAQIDETYNMSLVVVFWWDRQARGPVSVRFMHRDNTPENLMLAEMLRAGPGNKLAGDEAAIDASARKLLEAIGDLEPARANPYLTNGEK